MAAMLQHEKAPCCSLGSQSKLFGMLQRASPLSRHAATHAQISLLSETFCYTIFRRSQLNHAGQHGIRLHLGAFYMLTIETIQERLKTDYPVWTKIREMARGAFPNDFL
jgi:hypothetical protein